MNRNSWRYELDPRDPEYADPPEVDEEVVEDEEETWEVDPGPKHYCPPGEH